MVTTVDAMLAYVHECFVTAVPPGIVVTAMSLDDVVEHAAPMALDATNTVMFPYLMERLTLMRNGIDARMADIRQHVSRMKKVMAFDR